MRVDKGTALLRFLKDSATLRRKRIPSYGPGDKVVWFSDIPKDRAECRSPFLADGPGEFADIWLEVRKTRTPTRPPLPAAIADWVRPDDLEQAEKEPELLQEITVVVQRERPDPDDPSEHPRTIRESVPELQRLQGHPEVEDAWLEYLVNRWEPWAKEMLRWQEVHRVYEDIDFMRRRIEESEERYEMFLAVGLLQWRDSAGVAIKRHLLTAPAEVELDAARGILTVAPAASFEGLRIELDMLELHDQPRLDQGSLDEQLDEIDAQAWVRAKVGSVLRGIANQTNPNSQVDEDTLDAGASVDDVLRVRFAPALVLRERRPTALEEVLRRLIDSAGGNFDGGTTGPWERFLAEGEADGRSPGDPPSSSHSSADTSDRVLFPLPTNGEQRQIIDRIRARPYVVVKGPPGTGKSLTIANLICHCLARGERILVTAHAPKALNVLRDLLPEEVQALCVTALGSSRDDHRLLEEGVRGILRRQNEWRGESWSQARLRELENALDEIQRKLAETDRQLLECREAEVHSHTLQGGYAGTAARIGEHLEQQREHFGWFPVPLDGQPPCPLSPSELALLAEVHATLTPERLHDLALDLGDQALLLAPDEFRRVVEELVAAERAAARFARTGGRENVASLDDATKEALDSTAAWLRSADEVLIRADRVLGQAAQETFRDLLTGRIDRWSELLADLSSLLEAHESARDLLGAARVDIPTDFPLEQLRSDVERRLQHLRSGGRRGGRLFAPRVIKETRHVEERCAVEATPPKEPEQLERLLSFLRLRDCLEKFKASWSADLAIDPADPARSFAAAKEHVSELRRLVALFNEPLEGCLPCVPVVRRHLLAETSEREAWNEAIEAEAAARRLRTARGRLDELHSAVQRTLDGGRAHACLGQLAKAGEGRDPIAWREAWKEREEILAARERYSQYEKILNRIDEACAPLAALLRDTQADPSWKSRLHDLDRGWAWAAAKGWLNRVSDSTAYRDLQRSAHRIQDATENKTEELVALLAWRAFFARLDDSTVQNLNAWTRALDRVGKGTGKYAFRHRRTARRYLMACIPKIPAWVMPLHKVWETIDAEVGLFDTVIVDEASQAGVDALILLLLCKRVIVVGDEKQNSPEAVGVLEDDIARLARQHLNGFRFRDEFRPDASLFDHAERAFGNVVSLQEHFRCVPEIIRFSNDLCYSDAPLIPLRQAPPNRLPPLVAQQVAGGRCEGDGQRILNRAEAQAIVDAIRKCVEDPAYEGKTIGVIALQGHAQAELVGRLLAEALEPRVLQERKLRCGVPATFQGDQRDIVFLSLVTSPERQSRALTGLADQRRFNVAMSRARDQVWLFHSVQQHDLSPHCLRLRLLRFFQSPGGSRAEAVHNERERLLAEHRRFPRRLGEQPEPYGSWFEVDVALELLNRGYSIRPQYEVAGKRIDLMVEGVDARLAVECDGDAWHGPEEYESDMARQRQLERGTNLTFIRVRESEFYSDRATAVADIVTACKELGIRVGAEDEAALGNQLSEEETHTLEAATETTGVPRHSSEVDEESEDQPLAAEHGPFSGYSPALSFPDPRDASPTNLKAPLRHIIERDGPLTRASVYRLYVEGSPHLQRAGKVVRQAVNRALGAMLRSGEILQEDELGDSSPESLVVRLAETPRVRERPAGRRDLLEIPSSELLLVLNRSAASTAVAGDDDAVSRRLLDHYGYNRLTAIRRQHLGRILDLRRRKERE